MDKVKSRIIELSFIVLCLKLFNKYHPQDVFSFLKSCCIMFQTNRDMVQQATLKVMRQKYNYEHVLFELCRVAHREGADHSELQRLADVPRSTYYYKVNKQYPPTTLIMTDKELEVIKEFIYNFRYLGGVV